MISNFKVAKALYDKLNALTALKIVKDGEAYEPSPSIDFIKEKVMLGSVNITLSQGDSENANGLYQIDVYSSVSNRKTKWYGLNLRDTLKANFTKGLTASIEHDGQKIIVNNVNTPPMRMNESNSHYIHTIDVNFRVIG